MGPFTGQILPVKTLPEKAMSPLGSSKEMIDFMPVLIPLIRPERVREQTTTVHTVHTTVNPRPTFDPLNFQPVSEQAEWRPLIGQDQ